MPQRVEDEEKGGQNQLLGRKKKNTEIQENGWKYETARGRVGGGGNL